MSYPRPSNAPELTSVKRSRNHRVSPRRLRLEQLENRALLAAAIFTDQLDYAPGSTAQITGTGFALGETVRLHVERTDGVVDLPPGNLPWEITDGGAGDLDAVVDGNIATTWYVEEQYADSTLLLSAQGQTSGESAAWAFTDGSITGVAVDPQVGVATYGSNYAVTFVVDLDSAPSNPRTWSLSISGLPAGINASFSPASGSGTGGPSDSTLTLTNTTNLAPGNYTFTVKATGTGGTTGSATSTGTLTVSPKALTVSGVTALSKAYDGTTTATLNTSGATWLA